MSEASDLLDTASVKLDEAIIALQEVQEQLRVAKTNIWSIRRKLGMEIEVYKEESVVLISSR